MSSSDPSWSWGKFATKAQEWLFLQGVSTILLLVILYALWGMGQYAMNTAIPAHLNTIQAGYERIETRQEARAQRQEQLFERAIESFQQAHERDRQLIENLLRERKE